MKGGGSAYVSKLKALEEDYLLLDIGRNERLRRLAHKLGGQLRPRRSWTDKALYRVLAGHPPGRFLARAIDRLYKPPRIRKYKPRLYIPCDSKEQVGFIVSRLPARRRLAILLEAAEMEGL